MHVRTVSGELKQIPMGKCHKLFLNWYISDTLEDYFPLVASTVLMSYHQILRNWSPSMF